MATAVADLVLTNANVITMNPARPLAQAVAVANGRIVAVGTDRDAAAWTGRDDAVHDLHGRTVLPGFYDSHNHALFTGLDLARVRLAHAKSVDDVLAAIGERARTTPRGEWIVSSARWHETRL